MLRLRTQLANDDVRMYTRAIPEPVVASGQTVLEGMVTTASACPRLAGPAPEPASGSRPQQGPAARPSR